MNQQRQTARDVKDAETYEKKMDSVLRVTAVSVKNTVTNKIMVLYQFLFLLCPLLSLLFYVHLIQANSKMI